jgi:hypothetical protein
MKGILNRNFIIGFVVVLIFIGLSFMELSIFEAMERYIYDTEMRFSPAESQGDKKIVLIDIDDKSVNRLGPWPWPRHLIAEMITVLKRNNTRLIGLHLPLTEKEQNQGLREVRSFKTKFNAQPFARKDPNMFNWLVKNLEQLEEDQTHIYPVISWPRPISLLLLIRGFLSIVYLSRMLNSLKLH